MPMTAEKEMQHIGKTKGIANHDHDLIHELSERLDALWRYDQYVENAQGHDDLQKFWNELKNQDQANVKRMKELVAEEVEKECF